MKDPYPIAKKVSFHVGGQSFVNLSDALDYRLRTRIAMILGASGPYGGNINVTRIIDRAIELREVLSETPELIDETK